MERNRNLPLIAIGFESNPIPSLPGVQDEIAIMIDNLRFLSYSNIAHPIQFKIESFIKDEILEPNLNRAVIFHYAGHASSLKGLLNKRSKRSVFPRTYSFGKWKPKIVFLNACESKKYAHRFIEFGTKAVIVTNRDVCDRRATRFAIDLYTAFFNGDNIEDAFQKSRTKWYEENRESLKIDNIDRHLNEPDLERHLDSRQKCPYTLILAGGINYYNPYDLNAYKPLTFFNVLRPSTIVAVFLFQYLFGNKIVSLILAVIRFLSDCFFGG